MALPGNSIVEQEYQKRYGHHGTKIRPDIIIHTPAPDGGNRREGNSVVFELKRRAGRAKACQDFAKLDTALNELQYSLGVFVNICSCETQAAHYGGHFRDRIHFFAVRLVSDVVQLRHAFYTNGKLVENGISERA